MKEIPYVALRETAIEPTKSYSNLEAGWDLYSATKPEITDFNVFYQARVCTGIAVEIPQHWRWTIAPRSGLADKYGAWVHEGIIDCTYRGEVIVLLRWPKYRIGQPKLASEYRGDYYFYANDINIDIGTKIAQATLDFVPESVMVRRDKLSDSPRGTKGFGSSGF